MSSTAAPYGLRPVGVMGSTAFTHKVRVLKITDSYATSIFYGDVVKIVATGTVEKDVGTATATPLGVFLGCTYTDPGMLYKVFRQYWPASTVATDNFAYVLDDPFAVFQIQSAGSQAQTVIGNNVALVQGAGSTVTGMSAVAAGASPATTNTLPLKIIDFVYAPDSAPGDAFTDLLVTWNFGMHIYQTATGT